MVPGATRLTLKLELRSHPRRSELREPGDGGRLGASHSSRPCSCAAYTRKGSTLRRLNLVAGAVAYPPAMVLVGFPSYGPGRL